MRFLEKLAAPRLLKFCSPFFASQYTRLATEKHFHRGLPVGAGEDDAEWEAGLGVAVAVVVEVQTSTCCQAKTPVVMVQCNRCDHICNDLQVRFLCKS